MEKQQKEYATIVEDVYKLSTCKKYKFPRNVKNQTVDALKEELSKRVQLEIKNNISKKNGINVDIIDL